MATEYCIKIEGTTWGIDIEPVWRPIEVLVDRAWADGATAIVSMTVDLPPKRVYIGRGALNCVTLIKGFLAMRAWYIWTPKALCRHMVRNGGKLLNPGGN